MSDTYLLHDKEEVLKNLRIMDRRCSEEQPVRVNCLTGAKYLDCDVEKKTVYMEYPVRDWELNIAGRLHGGVICTMLDLIAGTAVFTFTGNWNPTVDMTVQFLRPANLGDVLCGEGTIISAGRRLFHIESKLYDKKSGKPVASALITYARINTAGK